MIQYSEQGTFITYIEEKGLLPLLQARYIQAERLYAYGKAYEIAAFLVVFQGIHTRESLLPLLEERLVSLRNRIIKLKEKQNGSIKSQRS